MTLPGGKFYLNAVAETNLAKGAAGKPISIAPDLWYGASDKLTLGLVHYSRGTSGFLTGFVNGLCFRGGSGGGACAAGLGSIYTTAGAEARIAIREGASRSRCRSASTRVRSSPTSCCRRRSA